MGIDSGAYNLILVLHLVTVVVGFGSVFLVAVSGAKARERGGAGGQAVAEVSFDVTVHWSQWFIYAVPLFGILLLLMSDDVFKFSQMWISISFLLYIAFLGLMHGLQVPTLRRMNELGAELQAGGPPGSGAELDALAKKAAAVGGVLNLIMVALVVLMVFKPGY